MELRRSHKKVIHVRLTTADLRRLYAVLDNEDHYFNMIVSKSQHEHVDVRMEVRLTDAEYYTTLLSEVEAVQL